MGKEYNYHAPPPLTLIFSPNWGPKGRKKILETGAPLPLSQGLDAHPPPPPPFSQGLDPALQCAWLYSDMVEHLIWNWADWVKNKDKEYAVVLK